jgi:radical SAM protein with 4Fe4S-binding SPASM domain
MSAEDFELYLDKIAPFGKHLYFHVKGESLLHPALGDFLWLAAVRGSEVSITTNGTLLEEKAEVLLGAHNVRKLSVSLHSHSGRADAEKYWLGVAAFLDKHRATRPFPVSLRLWNRGAAGLPPETERLWELLRARYPAAEVWEKASIGSLAQKLDEKVYLNQADKFTWPELGPRQDAEASDRRGFCRGLRNQIGVLVDGTVVPCCLDGEGVLRLGNLRESSLSDILASPRARAIYEGFSRRTIVEELCESCGYRQRFSRLAQWDQAV